MCIRFTTLLMMLAFGCGALMAQITGGNDRSPSDDLDYYNEDRQQGNAGGAIWWGTGAQLNFFSVNDQSTFLIGLTPIAGYKVTPWLSFGPRGSILYNSVSFRGTDENASFFTYSAGVFGRAKVFQQFFAHVEYNLENDVFDLDDNFDPIRRTRSVPYIGAGYSQGGGFQGGVGFELMILFPIREREYFNDPPYVIRSGINVNF